jgi:hypothetical protein
VIHPQTHWLDCGVHPGVQRGKAQHGGVCPYAPILGEQRESYLFGCSNETNNG